MDILFYVSVGVIALATIAFLIAYRRRLVWWFTCSKPQKRTQYDKNHKLAIVIPARNEGKTVLPLIESLLNQTYDKQCFDVHVVVKEKQDPTIDMIKEIMPTAFFYIDEKQKTKGHALDYCMKEICKEKKGYYDAFIIIDADCLLDEKFLSEMSNALGSGKDVYNSKLVVKNYLNHDKKSNSWASRCNGMIWTLMSELGNRAKSDRGITTMVLGTGLMIRSSLVESWNGWPYQQTLTEDIELQRSCALHHYSTEYVSYAVCYVEESTSLHVSNIRRQRWMSGVVHCDRIYDDKLRENIKTKEDKLNFYSFHCLYYVYWYFGFLCLATIFSLALGTILHFDHSPLSTYYFALAGCSIGIIYLGMLLMTIRCMVVDRKYMRMNFFTRIWICLTHPLYYMGYIGVMIKCFALKQKVDWKRIERVQFQEGAFEKTE